jgi:hypothetical protein
MEPPPLDKLPSAAQRAKESGQVGSHPNLRQCRDFPHRYYKASTQHRTHPASRVRPSTSIIARAARSED